MLTRTNADHNIISRISSLIGTLKCPYPGLTADLTADILSHIQTSIRQKVGCRL